MTSVFGHTQLAAMFFMLFIFLSFFSSISSLPFPNFTTLPLPSPAKGPEALAFDISGQGPFVGIADGRILKYRGGPTPGFSDFAFGTPNRTKVFCDGNSRFPLICGRPLGMEFNKRTGELIFVDAGIGKLMAVGPSGGLATSLATTADDGLPLRFPNGFTIDQTRGDYYFTDFSGVFGVRDMPLAVAFNDATGRLLKYDSGTKNVHVLLRGLAGPAGVAVSPDGSFVLVTEYIKRRIQKCILKGPRANTSQIVATFQGRPDNIKRTASGDYWVAVNMQTSLLQPNNPMAVKINANGDILENVSRSAQYNTTTISEVQEYKDAYYIGSLTANFVGIYKK